MLFKRWEMIVFVVAILNFVVFVLISLRIGGDAINGTIENGHYLLRSHATYTEVSRDVFMYSRIHVGTLFVTHPLGMLVAARARRRKKAQNSN